MSKFQITRGFVFHVPCLQEATTSLCVPAALSEDGPGPRWAPSSACPDRGIWLRGVGMVLVAARAGTTAATLPLHQIPFSLQLWCEADR